MKKTIKNCFLLLVLCCIIFVMPINSMKVNAYDAYTKEEIDAKIKELRDYFPPGAYWNHVGGYQGTLYQLTKNPQYSVTSNPCTCTKSHPYNSNGSLPSDCTCNQYGGTNKGIQCAGFARMFLDYVFHSTPNDYPSQWVDVNPDQLMPGDMIYSRDIYHYTVVIATDATKVYVAECNHGDNCNIKWDRPISKSDLKGLSAGSFFKHYIGNDYSTNTPNRAEVKAEALSSTSVQISWTNSRWAGYWLRRADSAEGPYKDIKTINSGLAGSFVDTTVEPDRTYYYRLMSFDSNGAGAFLANPDSVAVTTPSDILDEEAPVLDTPYISEASMSYFTVAFKATDNIGIKSAKVLVWPDDSDVSKAKTYDAVEKDGVYAVTVQIADYNYDFKNFNLKVNVADSKTTVTKQLSYDVKKGMKLSQIQMAAEIAKSQLGYAVSKSSETKYGARYGSASGWNPLFVKWVYDEAGITTYAPSPVFAFCTQVVCWARDNGYYHRVNGASWTYKDWSDGGATDDYIPVPGDIIVYDTNYATVSDGPDGLGIVSEVKGDTVYVVKNSSDSLRVEQSSFGTRNTSQVWGYIHVAFADALEITSQPGDVTVLDGATAKFTVAATGEGLTYQWQYSKDGGKTWVNNTVSSAKKATLSLTAKESFDGRLYHCIVTDANGQTVTSEAAGLTVKAPFTIINQPQAATATDGETVKFAVVATGENLTYQWQYSKDNGKTWVNNTVTSAKKATLSLTAKESYSGRLYHCIVTDENGKTLTSEAAGLTVKASVAITGQPKAVTATDGETVKFTVVATGEGLTYQWQLSKDGGKTWANNTVNSAKTATLSLTAKESLNGRVYRCVVTSASKQVVSETASLTVKAALSITSQPANVIATSGQAVKFTVAANGSGLTYQWQYSKDSGKTWVNSTATGAKTATMSTTAKDSFNGRMYRCVVTNASGTVNSEAAVLIVKAAAVTKPVITSQPANVSTTEGKTVKFSVTATGDGLSYQWQYSKDNGLTWIDGTIASAKTATYSTTAKKSFSGRLYRCIISNQAGTSVTSNFGILLVQ